MKHHFNLNDLDQFTCSESFFRHGFNRQLIYTEGVQYLAKNASCYWLIDEIAFVLLPKLLKHYPDGFYSIELVVNSNKGLITVGDGNNTMYIKHTIEYTDFPSTEEPFKLFLCESEGCYCLMLPSEY